MKQFHRIDQHGQAYVGFLDHASLAALRAWCEGLPARAAVERYLSHRRIQAQSSRGMLGRIRRRLIDIAEASGRDDLAEVFRDRNAAHARRGMPVHRAIEALRELHDREPQINDDISIWLPPRASRALKRLARGTDAAGASPSSLVDRHRWSWPSVGRRDCSILFALPVIDRISAPAGGTIATDSARCLA